MSHTERSPGACHRRDSVKARYLDFPGSRRLRGLTAQPHGGYVDDDPGPPRRSLRRSVSAWCSDRDGVVGQKKFCGTGNRGAVEQTHYPGWQVKSVQATIPNQSNAVAIAAAFASADSAAADTFDHASAPATLAAGSPPTRPEPWQSG